MFANLDLQKLLFGRLTIEAVPYHEPILLVTFIAVGIGGAALLGLITYMRWWGPLWRDWFTSVDHKKIGILYIVNSFLFFFAAGILALVIRTELAVPGMQFVDQDTYNQAFTMHGTIMLFLFVIPALSGFGNYIVPLQLVLSLSCLFNRGSIAAWFLGCK